MVLNMKISLCWDLNHQPISRGTTTLLLSYACSWYCTFCQKIICNWDYSEMSSSISRLLELTSYPIGDFLLLPNFSSSNQSPTSARASTFNHQYLVHKEIGEQNITGAVFYVVITYKVVKRENMLWQIRKVKYLYDIQLVVKSMMKGLNILEPSQSLPFDVLM